MGLVAGMVAFVGLFSNATESVNRAFSDAPTNLPAQVHLSVSPKNPWVKPGETVTLALYADGEIGVSAAEITLNYGKDVGLLDVKPGPYLGKDTLAAPKLLDEELRQASYAWARIGDTPLQTPPSELAFITMKAADGYPWNTWVTAQVSLADSRFKKLPIITLPFKLYVYDRLPVPTLVQPDSRFPTKATPTGPQPVFSLKTVSPATLKYKIEVSQDGFLTVLHTFDQTASPQGWDKAEYQSGDVAELVSPESLPPGQYQWRAYVWIQEIAQWGQSSSPEKFEVLSDPMGLTAVRPPVVTSLSAEGAPMTIEGWGFTPDTQVLLSMSGGGELLPAVHWESYSKIKVTIPTGTPPGLATIKLSRAGAKELTVPVLVLPPTLFAVQTELPWANQVIPGKEFSARVLTFNYGTDPLGVAVVAVHLPNPDLFELLEVTIDESGQVLKRGPEQVLLAVRDYSQATFKFRLAVERVTSPGSAGVRPSLVGNSLDFDLKPVLIGAVPGARWAELELIPASQRAEAVQVESSQKLSRIALAFNQASYRSLRSAFQQLAANTDSLDPVAELITQLQDHGLAMGRITGLMADAPAEIQASLFRLDRSMASPRQLQVVSSITTNNLLAEPEGIGEQSYVAEDQTISYTIRFDNPANALESVKDIIVMAQLGPGMDLGSVLDSSPHFHVMSVNVDRPRNTVIWVFKDINLPPNTVPPQGEGWVRFSARPLARPLDGMPSGTKITAKAAVRLDFQPPIETNEVTYTLDSQAPSTQVSPISSIQLDPSFQVPWQGSDEERGSGIQRIDLLASKNGGQFELVETTSGVSFSFLGEAGDTYGLATQGTDQVGHVEALPSKPDLVVTIGQPLTFKPGLHLLGIPVVTDEYSQHLLVSPGSAWSSWDAFEQQYHSSKAGAAFPPVENGRPGYGLWAQFENEANVVITGQPVPHDQPYTIDLHAGWNLIANPFASAMPWSIDEVKVRVEGQEVAVREAQGLGWTEDFLWGWDGAAYELVYDSSVVPNIVSSLEPFRGYWIEAHRDLTLVLTPPR